VREEIQDIPLFTTESVLFPGMSLPLHLSEERQRLMIEDCLQADRRFGILLAKPTPAGSDLDTVYTVGTAALITQVETPEEGGLDVQTAGLERFRVLQLLRSEPYMLGRIEPFPLEGVRSPEVVRQIKRTGELFVRYLRLLGEALGTEVRIVNAPRDPSSLAYLIGIALQVPMEEKQELLSILSLPRLLARERAILGREEVLLTRMIEVQKADQGYLRGRTGYLSLN